MSPLVAVSIAAGALAAAAAHRLVRPLLGLRTLAEALVGALLAAGITVGIGGPLRLETLDYLVGMSAFLPVVLVMLAAAAAGSGADPRARRVLLLSWAVAVFPVAALGPLAFTAGCPEVWCRFADFAGALPLFVSSCAFVVLAWLPAASPMARLGAPRGRAALAAVGVLWLAWLVWLASLEAAIDHYTWRILLAGVVGPIAAAAGWRAVDLLRDVPRHPLRSIGSGLLAGMVATAPGAVSVSFPWTAVVGALAGAVAALVFDGPAGQLSGLAARWGITLLAATAVGFLAPPISGDTIGVLFSAQVSVLLVPMLVFAAVVLWSGLVSAPVWVLVRRSQVRPRSR